MSFEPNTVAAAFELARAAHAGQIDKSGQPYIYHPVRVALRLDSQTARVVAMLHDVVEDTAVTLDELRADGWLEDIVLAIDALTHRKGELYGDYIDRVRDNGLAVRVKLADIADNTSPDRLAKLPKDVQERLIAKYGFARKRLVANN